jgi:hypothetical protein
VSPPRALNEKEFALQDVYAFAAQLQELHPGNRHVPDKIRQQLQVLRNLGFVEFLGHGRYRGGWAAPGVCGGRRGDRSALQRGPNLCQRYDPLPIDSTQQTPHNTRHRPLRFARG